MTAFGLKVMACLCMLADHIGYCEGILWMRVIGRLAFPIYAFLIANGYRHTRNVSRYMLRLFCAAVISEPCFDFFVSHTWFDPAHQNVLWTLLLGLICLACKERMCRIGKPGKLLFPLSVILVCGAAILASTDYAAVGVLSVLAFGAGKKSRTADTADGRGLADPDRTRCGRAGLTFPGAGAPEPICCLLFALVTFLRPLAFCGKRLAGSFDLTLLQTAEEIFGGFSEWDVVNLLRISALFPILLYNGKKGASEHFRGSILMQCGFYLFYPAHMLLLALLL